MLYNCYIFICDWIHIFFRKHGFRDHRQRRGREKVDYGEGIAMTGFYFALKGDIGGIFPEAVLRTLSGHRDVAPCRIRSPGKRSATGEACRHAGRTTETQKAHPAGWALHLFDAWQFPTLTWGDPTLPSALRRFTSEFGMGSGGTTALVPPGKFFVLSMQFFILRTQL